MDDNLDVKAGEEVKLPEESSTLEQTTGEVKAQEAEVATEAEGTETETAESNKGASQRIRELNAKAKAEHEARVLAEAEKQSLAERLAEITGSVEPNGTQVPQYQPQYQPGQEITTDQLAGDVTATANAIVDLRLKQERAINRINNESRDAVSKYPQLDPKSELFDPELSDTVTEATESYVKTQPFTASVSKFVDRMMKPYQRSVAKEVGEVTENIAKQVSETALRPTSIRKQEKAASEKTIAELEQELGVVTN